jgi:hypothetical protein
MRRGGGEKASGNVRSVSAEEIKRRESAAKISGGFLSRISSAYLSGRSPVALLKLDLADASVASRKDGRRSI